MLSPKPERYKNFLAVSDITETDLRAGILPAMYFRYLSEALYVFSLLFLTKE